MHKLLDFLLNSENRALLTWLGGGLASVASAIWVVLKFIAERSKKESPAGTVAGQSVYVGRGVGIGGSGKVTIGNVRVGLGLGAIALIGLLLLLLGLVGYLLAPSVAEAGGQLPSFNLTFDCSGRPDAPNALEPADEKALLAFQDFVESHDGLQVYFSVKINDDCGACSCTKARTFRWSDDLRPLLFIDEPRKKGENYEASQQTSTVIGRGHHLEFVDVDKMARVGHYYLPSYEQQPENGLYRKGAYGTFLTYDGPFTAHFEAGTGYSMCYLEPITWVSPQLFDRLLCAQRRGKMSLYERASHNCLFNSVDDQLKTVVGK